MNIFNETPEQERLLNKLVMDGYKWPVGVWEVKRIKAIVTYKQFQGRDGWIVWRGGEQPVGDDVMVDTMYKNGSVESGELASHYDWDLEFPQFAIRAYRLHKAEQPKGHPHAELYQELADVAKESAEPWREFQLKIGDNFHDCVSASQLFHAEEEYRRKPKMKLIHGVEVPDISFVPDNQRKYFYTRPCSLFLFGKSIYVDGNEGDEHLSNNGMCYPDTEEGKQAAILHAKAMLGIVGDSVIR